MAFLVLAFLVSVRQAAKHFNTTPYLFWRLIRNREIPFYRLSPRSTRVDLDELRHFVRLFPESLSEDGDDSANAIIKQGGTVAGRKG